MHYTFELVLIGIIKKQIVDFSIPGYIERDLTRFLHIHPKRPHHSPFTTPLPVLVKHNN